MTTYRNKGAKNIPVSQAVGETFGSKFTCIVYKLLQGKVLRKFQITANKMQLFLNLFIFTDALHVSGLSSAHHQEYITVHATSGIVKPILLLAATVEEMELLRPSSGAHNCTYSFRYCQTNTAASC
jgi:hypothetical protein